MKAGDLVIMPGATTACHSPDTSVGLVVSSTIVRNRVSIMWADGDGVVDHEPIQFLEVISESR